MHPIIDYTFTSKKTEEEWRIGVGAVSSFDLSKAGFKADEVEKLSKALEKATHIYAKRIEKCILDAMQSKKLIIVH